MSLTERLSELEKQTLVAGCSFGRFLAELPADTHAILQRLLAAGISNQALRTELALEGHRFSRDTIANHRNQRCLCVASERTVA